MYIPRSNSNPMHETELSVSRISGFDFYNRTGLILRMNEDSFWHVSCICGWSTYVMGDKAKALEFAKIHHNAEQEKIKAATEVRPTNIDSRTFMSDNDYNESVLIDYAFNASKKASKERKPVASKAIQRKKRKHKIMRIFNKNKKQKREKDADT